ncbi:MAG: SPFH domain-containing protein, partial [Lentisphaeria bacterium]
MNKQEKKNGLVSLLGTLQFLFRALRIIILLVLVLIVFSGSFYVREDEQAMVLRFGKAVGSQLLESGSWHWAWPEPIDKVVRIPSKRNLSIISDVFWYEEGLFEDDKSLVPGRDGYLLTADMNILHLKTSAVCQIVDPLKYYFRMVEGDRGALLKGILNRA